jgi:hypothetical protein
MASKGAVDISSVPPDLPVVRLPVPKLAVQGRYNQNLFLGVPPRFLQGIAERPLPCNYNAIQFVSAFHGGNTGSNPVGDASLEPTTSSHSLENS